MPMASSPPASLGPPQPKGVKVVTSLAAAALDGSLPLLLNQLDPSQAVAPMAAAALDGSLPGKVETQAVNPLIAAWESETQVISSPTSKNQQHPLESTKATPPAEAIKAVKPLATAALAGSLPGKLETQVGESPSQPASPVPLGLVAAVNATWASDSSLPEAGPAAALSTEAPVVAAADDAEPATPQETSERPAWIGTLLDDPPS